ncbi:MAG: hypothetical protein D6722_25810 [Bacteroidetes bacterium]|nr:MAG: hypothetical protein D6722_25810 [Bacteroidota bacterium]
MMIKIFLLWASLWAGSLGALMGQVRPAPAPWTIDGQAPEWGFKARPEPLGWSWALAQDDEMLYLGVRIPELQQQQQILITGLTLWLYPQGKKRQRRGITFPLGMPVEQQPADTETLEYYRAERQWCPPIPARPGLELLRFYEQPEPVWGEALNPGGLSAALGCDAEGVMIYELAIPLAALPGLEDGEGTLDLAFESGALGRPRDLRGTDAAGGTYGINSQRGGWADEAARQRQARMDRYRAFASPLRLRLRRLSLPSETK